MKAMKSWTPIILALATGIAGLGGCQKQQRLFDGQTLDGWHQIGTGEWTVVDGVIDGTASKEEKTYSLLVSDETYDDFEVSFEYRVLQGNSGFYFRVEETGRSNGVAGFQVEVDDYKPGGLYETDGRGWVVEPTPQEAATWHRKGQWNSVTLSAVGPELLVCVNGAKTAQIEDHEGRRVGHLALQLHGGQDMHVQFRNITLRYR
jgi:hypothetical protein